MKKLFRFASVASILVVMGAATSAYAQSSQMTYVNIPFEFSFAKKVLPAGNYSLIKSPEHLLTLRDAGGQTIGLAFTTGIQSPNLSLNSRLKFRSLNGQKVLSEVWFQDSSLGEILRSTAPEARGAAVNARASGDRQAVGQE